MIKDEIQKAIFRALKEQNQTELTVLRFLSSQIKYEEIAKQKELTDEEVIAVLQKELKKRKEEIEMFRKGKRDDLVEEEEKQLPVIQRYLPEQLSEEELVKIINEAILTIDNKGDIGRIIGLVMTKVKGRADGSLVASLVKQKLVKH